MDDLFLVDAPVAGYDPGTVLRNVTLREARAIECNRCGDCCNGMSDHVKKDEATGFPMFTWGSHFPDDLYENRYGVRLLNPIVLGDGGPCVAKKDQGFETDMDGKPYTAFQCSMWREGEPSTCILKAAFPNPDPKKLEQIRPRSCGDFPVYGAEVDAAILAGKPFIPPTGALPRCSWYGIRIEGPWRNTPKWEERWERQQLGLPVEELLSFEQLVALSGDDDGSSA